MAVLQIIKEYARKRWEVGGLVLRGQPTDPSNGDGTATIWLDSDDLQFGKKTIKFSNMNLADINDIECNAFHCDPSSAGSTLPYSYTEPSNSWFFVNSRHPPTCPEIRLIDQSTRDFYRVQVAATSLRAILDDDQTATY